MQNFNEFTKIALSEFCRNWGIDRTIDLGNQILSLPEFASIAKEGDSIIQGEIAETICYLQIQDWIKRKSIKNVGLYQGLFIKSTNLEKDYITEIDLVLVTPQIVFLIEVKSYKGYKIITDDFTISRRKKDTDVYSQHIKHFEAFHDLCGGMSLKAEDTRPYIIPLVYLFSYGEVKDMRNEKSKNAMPLLLEHNIISFIESYLDRQAVWNIKDMITALNYVASHSERLKPEHMKYINKLHNKM